MVKKQESVMDKVKLFLGLEGLEKPTTPKRTKKETAKQPSTINLSYFNKKTTSEIKIIAPKKYSNAVAVTNLLKEDVPVILNFKHLDASSTKRFMDFISGTIYSINGDMTKLSKDLVLLTSEKTAITEETLKSTPREKTRGQEEIIVNYITKN